MTLTEIFSKNYLFDPTPSTETRMYLPLLIVFGVLIFLSFFLRLFPIKVEKINRRFVTAFLWPNIFGLLYLFGRHEGLPWLGSRIFLVLILAVLSLWILANIVWSVRFVPAYLKEKEKRERYERYLPKPKRG